MSLGWGLRGFIGGGPLGAMIPGAMVAMALCLLLRRTDAQANGIAAAFGAIGVGFGGQMTYGQTIGLTVHAETAAWGLLGLTVKGAIWGLLGGAVLGAGLIAYGLPRRRVSLASVALILACWIGRKAVNEPRLIYFSDPINKPRPEIWAGLMLAAAAFLLVVRNRVAWTFAWIACLGGGLGFGLGGWLNALGRNSGWEPPVDWWKLMEFTFGFLFGAALGLAAWVCRKDLTPPALESEPSPVLFAVLLPLVPLAIAAERASGFRFVYMTAGALLLFAASFRARFAWQIAIGMTCTAFGVDFLHSRPDWNQPLLWTFVTAGSAVAAWFADRSRGDLPRMLLLLTWLAVAISHLKSWMPPFLWVSPKSWAHAEVEIAFTAMAIAVTWFVASRLSGGPPSGVL